MRTILIALLLFLGCDSKPTNPPVLLGADSTAVVDQSKGYVRKRYCKKYVWVRLPYAPGGMLMEVIYDCTPTETNRDGYSMDPGGNKLVGDSL